MRLNADTCTAEISRQIKKSSPSTEKTKRLDPSDYPLGEHSKIMMPPFLVLPFHGEPAGEASLRDADVPQTIQVSLGLVRSANLGFFT